MGKIVGGIIKSAIIIRVFFVGLSLFILSANQILAAGTQDAETLINTVCSTCHKFKGKEESRFNLKGPDLMWGGSKYQRDWLIRWLTGKEPLLYAKSYRWDQGQEPDVHVTVTETQANALADYFEKNLKDSRVTVGAFDLAKVTKKDVRMVRSSIKNMPVLAATRLKKTGNWSEDRKASIWPIPETGIMPIGYFDSESTRKTTHPIAESFWPMPPSHNYEV